ncbi:YciI family protein [Dyadobacter sp. NIV53]|uniref:YciI family protein n=1 Tax=Dyadobacter sp. NIV53 TaxID=2861765 RepID=UPI001C87B25A|nr:YciI family protein [Dyadobacter sp. NIV53]
MEKFLLLIREDMEKLKVLPDEEFQACIHRMGQWVEELAETGNYVAAEPLRTIGRYVSKENVLSDGPFIEAKEAISGYFIINAENLEQAAAIAQTCPQVVNGNSVVEVRPILELDEENF